MYKTTKKLTLRTETVRVLVDSQLSGALGAGTLTCPKSGMGCSIDPMLNCPSYDCITHQGVGTCTAPPTAGITCVNCGTP